MKRFCLFGLAIAVALVLTPPTAVGRSQRERLSLGRVNIISADDGGVVDVHIPAAADLAFPLLSRNPDLQVQGSGRFAGIVLTREPAFERDTLVGAIIRRCAKRACKGRGIPLTNPMNMKVGSRIQLSPGDYKLYVITDGAPIKVRLVLHGLKGERSVAVQRRIDYSIGEMAVHVRGPERAPLYVAGEAVDLDRPAFVLDALWLAGTPSGFTDLGTCLYEGVPSTPEPVAYSTLCEELGARERSSTRITGSIGFEELYLLFDSPLPRGPWGAGSNLSCSCVPSEAGSWRLVVKQ